MFIVYHGSSRLSRKKSNFFQELPPKVAILLLPTVVKDGEHDYSGSGELTIEKNPDVTLLSIYHQSTDFKHRNLLLAQSIEKYTLFLDTRQSASVRKTAHEERYSL